MPNTSCQVTPYITDATVTYTSSDRVFRVTDQLRTGSLVPNETVQALDQVFVLAAGSWVCVPFAPQALRYRSTGNSALHRDAASLFPLQIRT